MSINAIVSGVYWGENGVHELTLEGPERGQPILHFRDPAPPDVNLLTGQKVWGSSSTLMLGETKIADREGYTLIKFCVPWIGEVIDKGKSSQSPSPSP